MKVNCGEGATESLAIFASGFPAPGEAMPASAASCRGSKVAKGSRRVVESGLPRRSLGRFGSSIGSLEVEVEADAEADVFAGGFVAFGGLGSGRTAAGFWWAFLSLSC